MNYNKKLDNMNLYAKVPKSNNDQNVPSNQSYVLSSVSLSKHSKNGGSLKSYEGDDIFQSGNGNTTNLNGNANISVFH